MAEGGMPGHNDEAFTIHNSIQRLKETGDLFKGVLGKGIDLAKTIEKGKQYFNMGLERFLTAQEKGYEIALAEIRNGRKRSHWMWYIFPQMVGLGMTETSRYYAIRDIKEASDYLMDETLGNRLIKISQALLELKTNDAHAVFGSPDDLKLQSSMTLFDCVPATFPVFRRVLDKFYGDERDKRTLELLENQKEL